MRTVRTIALLALAVGVIAAGPSEPEITDRCGDTRTGFAGTTYDHPVPPGTDLAAVDVVDRADGGVDVVFDVCGDRLPVATNDSVRLTWDLPALGDCSRSRATVRITNTVNQGGLVGEYGLTCIIDSDDCPPAFPDPSSCSSSVSSTVGTATVPVRADGTRATVSVDRSQLTPALAASLTPGAALTDLIATGSTLAGTNLEYSPTGDPGDADLVAVSAIDRAEGRDHVLGEDLG